VRLFIRGLEARNNAPRQSATPAPPALTSNPAMRAAFADEITTDDLAFRK